MAGASAQRLDHKEEHRRCRWRKLSPQTEGPAGEPVGSFHDTTLRPPAAGCFNSCNQSRGARDPQHCQESSRPKRLPGMNPSTAQGLSHEMQSTDLLGPDLKLLHCGNISRFQANKQDLVAGPQKLEGNFLLSFKPSTKDSNQFRFSRKLPWSCGGK